MRRPVVGVIGNAYRVENRFQTQMVGERNLRAVADVAGALPLMFAGSPEITDIGALLDVVDGVVLTGARANVHPTRFKTEPHERHEPYDIHRDDVALALTEACVARGVPIFGICRGLQEMNVAFGGSLHPEIREIPGRMNHRMPRLENGEIHPDPTVVFADRHDVHLTPGGTFASLLGCETIRVNSLHGQGILEPGLRVVIEGIAEDGTIEAIRIADAPAFALGVQWHAEYDPQRNPINRKLFEAFGEALRVHNAAELRPENRSRHQGRMRCGTAIGQDATAEGVDGVRRGPVVCRTPEGRGAAGGGSDAGPDRGREEGGQAVVLFGA